MSDSAPPRPSDTGAYRSGTAARLAGIPVETLRVWERRYNVVGPRLSGGGQRLYSNAEIKRLTLIKRLVDLGHPIGVIAALDDTALAEMHENTRALQHAPPATDFALQKMLRIALVSRLPISGRVQDALAGTALRIVGTCDDPEHAAEHFAEVRAEVVIIELPTLFDREVPRVAAIKAACGAASAIVLYRYAQSAVIRRLRNAGHAVARATANATEIETICLSLLRYAPQASELLSGTPDGAGPPPPRFDEATLAQLSEASRVVECECPRHLVDLVMSLADFERYSAECASRSPADVALHLDLQRAAGYARAVVERALERTARAEGFELPPPAQVHTRSA